MRSRSAAGTPGPWSAIVIRTMPLARAARTAMPRASVHSTALRTTFSTARRSTS
jgi:hypothetical protein